MKNLIIIFINCVFLVMAGCSLQQNRVMLCFDELSILPLEQYNQEILDYKVLFFDDSKREFLLESRNSELSLNLPVGKNVPFLIYPVVKGILLKPAGAIFPNHYDEQRGMLRFDWRLGPLTEMLMKFVEKGCSLEDFNIAKLEGYLLDRFGESPWDWDQQSFIEALNQGKAGYFDIRKRKKIETALDLEPGNYFSEYPGIESVLNSNGTMVFTLFQGYNRFFNEDFSSLYHVQLTEYELTIHKEKLD